MVEDLNTNPLNESPEDYKPKNVPGLIAYITVEDADKAIHFYREVFRFELIRLPIRKDDKIMHAAMQLNDARIRIAPEGAWGKTRMTPKNLNIQCPISLYVYVHDVDGLYRHALEKQAVIIREPTEVFWGDKICTIQDLDGYEWTFATHIRDNQPQTKAP